jgi:DNA-binding MarR family transcriptional regulator
MMSMEVGKRAAPSLLYCVKRLELAIKSRFDEMLRDAGVTTPQYTALTVLAQGDGISAAQLARDSFVTPQSVADMLRLLEGRGLIRRAPNPRNGREVLVHITDAGRALLVRFADAEADLERRLVTGLTDGQVREFRTTVTGMWELLR